MECPICLEDKSEHYKFKGCTHSVCNKCCRKMRNGCLPNLNGFFRFIPQKYSKCLSCPMCRTNEPILDIKFLQTKYNKEYTNYIENELYGYYTKTITYPKLINKLVILSHNRPTRQPIRLFIPKRV